jgi:hypothetical protein
VVRCGSGGSGKQDDKGVIDILRAVFTVVRVRNRDMAVLGVAYGVGFRAVARGVCFKTPFATVAAVAVSVVTRLHADEAVVTDLGITVFILDKVDLAHCRWIRPCARSLCSFDKGNREQGRRSHGARLGW